MGSILIARSGAAPRALPTGQTEFTVTLKKYAAYKKILSALGALLNSFR